MSEISNLKLYKEQRGAPAYSFDHISAPRSTPTHILSRSSSPYLPLEGLLENNDVLMPQRLEHTYLPIRGLLHDLVLVRRFLELLDRNCIDR